MKCKTQSEVALLLDAKDIELLKTTFPFWDELSKRETDLLLSGTKSICYQQGSHIHSPTNECVGVLLVKSGELRTYILSKGGKEVTLFRLNEGEVCVLSASCLISSITFDVFIDAQQDMQVLHIDSAVFSQLQDNNIHVENFALKVAANRFSDVVWAMEQMLFMSFDARLAVFLLDETSKNGADNLALTHEQIAKYIGSAREVVSRMLNYFAKEGMVRLHRGHIEIIDKPALQKLVQSKGK
ncbi:Crp/Fnr family transcriptional regulator [Synergistaceae bacterium OttesenSCG-928-D05]|nr:Crp/Fnr family transcriptional regulator [Synergistaceae bacterium OttesenSCG-928-D05]